MNSKLCEILSRHEWSLHVSPRRFLRVTRLNPSPSWEYFTTLDYEWNAIRGRLPYRWTIWVRALLLISSGMLCPWVDCAFGRFTLAHVWLALSA
jgi:hypothetical protein